MKRVLVVLLSLGLIMAFGMTASAADLKIGGSYYAQGWYVDNPTLSDPNSHGSNTGSVAFYNQRLRLEPVITVADGLMLTMRLDALEKVWGGAEWKMGSSSDAPFGDPMEDNRNRAANPYALNYIKTQENIEFERSYVTAVTKIGIFQVGYQQAGLPSLGTDFLNSDYTCGSIVYILPGLVGGKLTVIAATEKLYEDTLDGSRKDSDVNTYALVGIWKLNAGEVGGGYGYYDVAALKATPDQLRMPLHVFDVWAKNAWGPLYVEGEIFYIAGEGKFDNNVDDDFDVNFWGAYAKVNYDMGPAYLGGLAWYISGQDPDDEDVTGGMMSTIHGMENFAPTLIFQNFTYNTWVHGSEALGGRADNVLAGQLYAGYKPTPKTNIKAAVTYAKADEVATGWDDEYGTEVDLTASYKIFDNLEYMVGAAYFFAGDYFKEGDPTCTVDDDYMLIHKLTLKF